jgi:hypothetical protein
MVLALFLVVISGTSVEAQEPCEPSSTFYEMISGATPVAFPQATPVDFPEATPGASPEATPGASPEATPGASIAAMVCTIELSRSGIRPSSAGIWAGTNVTFENIDTVPVRVKIAQRGSCFFDTRSLRSNQRYSHTFPNPPTIITGESLTCRYDPDPAHGLSGELVIFGLPVVGIGIPGPMQYSSGLLAVIAAFSAVTALGLRRH